MTWKLMEHTTVCGRECDCLVMIGYTTKEAAERAAVKRNRKENTTKYFAKLGEMFDTTGN